MTWTPHSTVAVIVEQDGKFLMVEELCHGELVINQPAGHLDENERLIDACVRETLEETAWTIELESIVGFYGSKANNGVTYHRFCFKGRAIKHNPEMALDSGIVAARWLTVEEIRNAPNLRSPMVLTCLDDYLAGQSFPLSLINDFQVTIA